MTDPFDSLYEPTTPVAPPREFTARLRLAMTREVFSGGTMSTTAPQSVPKEDERAPAWPPALTPYLVVSDARATLAWYAEVFGARQRGELHEDADGTIGHAEVGIGDAVLMFAEASDLYPEVPVRAPDSQSTFSRTFSHSLHLRVDDVDATVATARRLAATVEREPADEPYGRAAVIVDPFGHRWILLRPPGRATRWRQGDIAHVTMVAPDAERAKTFYETVLRVPFEPGGSPGSWGADTAPEFSVWSPPDQEPQVQLCYRVDDLDAALERVRAAGGTSTGVDRKPYGLLAECVDDQGVRFQLWQPVD